MSPRAKKITTQVSSSGAGIFLETHLPATFATIAPTRRYAPRLPVQPLNTIAHQGSPRPGSYDRDAERGAGGRVIR